ncbi:unnamed protein product [Staurois parvus]|uniref:Uncharacterized protein n=1 Tax=Staurois parvus TaxID=386267 RepID=A0ABN9EMC7_9NEOB|nr:unnamed protein product [Staurois parvus]
MISELIISALQCRPAVPLTIASYQCPAVLPGSAATPPVSFAYQCPSVPPIIDHHCCISVQHHQCLLINAHQCCLISATSSVQPISAPQCCLSLPPHQCPSVLKICATSSVPISAAYQCSLI